jgi:hypothetical protein
MIYLIIAWRVLHVVTLGRDCPDLPCDVVFDTEEWQAAWLITHRAPPPATPPKLGVRVRLIAGFGGFGSLGICVTLRINANRMIFVGIVHILPDRDGCAGISDLY